MATGTEQYYERRADEYDLVYRRPERQTDLARLTGDVVALLEGKNVIEVAAGTGWWTAAYADGAASVTATDVNPAPLAVARSRRRWPGSVRFVQADAFRLTEVPGRFDAAFIGFFWSHAPLRQLDGFVSGLVDRLEPGALVVVVDNRYVEGSNWPIARTDEDGNTYQDRHLADGSTWEVLKNFPTPAEVQSRLGPFASDVTVTALEYYWLATARTPEAPGRPGKPTF